MAGRAATTNVIPGDFALAVGAADMPAPKGWHWCPLESVARLESGHTPSRSFPEYWDGPIQWIGIPDAREHHGGTIVQTRQTITELGIANSAARLLPKGTVCLSRTASVGYVVEMGQEMSTSQDFVNFICGPSLRPDFLKHLFIAEKDALLRFGKGTTHTTIYYPEVKAFHICLPPVAEQRRIVAKLEALQSRSRRAREALDAIPPLLEKLRQSILAAAFRGDLTKDWRAQHPDVEPASVLLQRIRTERRKKWEEAELSKLVAKGKPPKDDQWKAKYVEPRPVDTTGLPELPEGWCWAALDELTLLAGGITKGQKRAESARLRSIPYLRVANVQRGFLDLTEVKAIDATDEEIAELELRPGDILLNEGGDRDKLGRGWVWEGELDCCIHQNHVFRARPAHPDLRPKYVSHYANHHGQNFFLDQGKQTTNLASVSLSRVRRLPVALPPSDEMAVAEESVTYRLEAVRVFGRSLVESVSRLGLLDRGILSKAFRGELVRPDPDDEPVSVLPASTVTPESLSRAPGTKRTAPGSPPRRHGAS